jgi:DNA-directed RNA polymerase specialized sigma24 family protein
MIKDKIILIAKKNKTWIEVVVTFGCTKETAEDLVQEMYIKIQKLLEKGVTNDIMYGDEINYYYIFKTLKSLYIDLKRKGKNIEKFSLDVPLSEAIDNYYKYNVDEIVNYDEEYDKIKISLSKMYWYDRKVYEIVEEGESLAELSRQSKIHYYSLYNTYNKVKRKLKKLL